MINRSFIMDIENDEKDREIVAIIIDLSSNLVLQSIAEGAETKLEIDYLNSKGCNIVQSYYFTPPLPANQLHHWVEKITRN